MRRLIGTVCHDFADNAPWIEDYQHRQTATVHGRGQLD
jgi:hypothetical protein